MPYPSSFPLYLCQELAARQRKNPNYSQRAFAKTLGVSSSFLSKVMNGKKTLGEETFLKIATRLQLNEELMEYYHAKLPGFKVADMLFNSVDLDVFHHISDWHHYAILEAVTLRDFEPSAAWISRTLGISEEKAQSSIDRLIRLGHLKKGEKEEFKSNTKNLTTTDYEIPSAACREHERQVLDLAIKALDQVPIEARDQSSLTLAIPASRFQEAREKIDQFRREMASLLQRRGARDAIYHLSISFYPVTQQSKEKK